MRRLLLVLVFSSLVGFPLGHAADPSSAWITARPMTLMDMGLLRLERMLVEEVSEAYRATGVFRNVSVLAAHDSRADRIIVAVHVTLSRAKALDAVTCEEMRQLIARYIRADMPSYFTRDPRDAPPPAVLDHLEASMVLSLAAAPAGDPGSPTSVCEGSIRSS